MPVTGLPGCWPVVPLLISKAPVELNVESSVAVKAPVTAAVPVTAKDVPFQVRLEDCAITLVDEAKKIPELVNVVRFVPPLAVPKVPARVIAPVVAVLGVNPVVPALNEDAVAVVETLTKSTPFQAQTADSLATMVTPVVGPTPTNLIDWVLPVLLMTM